MRPACSKDYEGVENLVKTLDLSENLLADLQQYNKARRDDVSILPFMPTSNGLSGNLYLLKFRNLPCWKTSDRVIS